MAKQIGLSFKYLPDDSVTILTVPDTATLRDVKDAWSSNTGLSADDHTFRVFGGGDVLPDHGTLKDRLPHGAFGICIEVDPFSTLTIDVLQDLRTSASACAETTVADIIRQVRDNLGLEDREMHLMVADKALDPARTLADQQVPVDAAITADLAFTVDVPTTAPVDLVHEEPGEDEEEVEETEEQEPDLLLHPDRRVVCTGSDHAACLLSADLPAEGHGTQAGAGGAREAFGQQQPPPPEKLRLRVVDWRRGMKELNGSLVVPSPVTGGGVSAAVAAELDLDPAKVEMWRREGRAESGEEVAEVFVDGVGICFVDVAGRTWEDKEVKDNLRTLTEDDRAPFLVPGRGSILLHIAKRDW